jgi:glycosyltransferase involved in cell wall biosynthesis
MRVILTCNFSPWSAYTGGGQISTHHLASALSRRGHDVNVIFTKVPWEHVAPPETTPYRLHWAALYHFWSQSQAPLRSLTALTVARQVEALCANGKPTIVHGQGEESAAIPRLAERLPIGFVLTSRYGALPQASPHRWRRIISGLSLPKYAALGIAARGARICAPPSRFGGELLGRTYSIPDRNIEPVHNGVPDAFLDYHWVTEGAHERPLLFFGRFLKVKGLSDLLNAFARLGQVAPRLRLVGKGPDAAKLRRQVRRLGIEARVEWRPWADQQTLGRLIEDSRAVILPSHWENFSLAVLSAMAVGAPLITTDVGGTLEIAEDGVNALVCPPGSVDALETALRRILDDPAEAAALGAAAAKRVRRDFTWDVAAAQFEAIYERVLPGASSSVRARPAKGRS